jgi:hypothetical protein
MEFLPGATIPSCEVRNPKPQKNVIPPLNMFQRDEPGR